MDQQFDDRLAQQLGTIEARGQRHLTMAARRIARATAGDVAMRAAVLPPAIGVVATPFGGIDPAVLLASTLAWPALVFVASYVLSRRRDDTDRGAALGLVDRRLRLKDRILTSAEFAGQHDGDGFRQAALHEAQPWLERALFAPIDSIVPATTPPLRRYWPFVAAALALLGVALLIDRATDPVRTGMPRVAGQTGTVQTVLAAIGVRPTPHDAPPPIADPRGPALADPRTGGAGDAGRHASGNAGTAANRNAPSGAGRAGKAGDPPALAGAPSSADAATSEISPPAGSRGQRQGATTTPRQPARTGAQAATAPAGTHTPAGAPADAPQTPAPPQRADARTGNQGTTPRPGSPAPPRPAAPQSGNAARPNAPKRSQDGQQSSQNSPRNSGQKGNQGVGRAAGQDALKKARGASSLLLAVPMDDRLVGTANAGRVGSSERAATPRAAPAAAIAAQGRGNQRGDAGRILHRTDSLHDDRVLGNFFRRGGGTAGGTQGR